MDLNSDSSGTPTKSELSKLSSPTGRVEPSFSPENHSPASNGSAPSRASLGLGVFGILFAPVFGLGILPAVVGIVFGHLGRRGDSTSRIRATVGLVLSYLAVAVSVSAMVLAVLPILLAFLSSTGLTPSTS